MADNPFMGTIQGMDAGVSWAHQAASVAMQKQQLDQQMQQHQEMKRQFDVKIGQQMFEQYNDILPMGPGEFKNTRLKQFQEQWTNAGYKVDDTWLAAAKDKDYSIKIGSYLKQIGAIDDSEIADSVMRSIPGGMQKEASIKMMEEGLQGAMRVKAAKAAADRIDARQNTRIDATAANKAIGQADTATKNDMQVFRAAQNMGDLVRAIDRGEIKDTPQLLSKIQTEEQKVMRGNGTLAEGSSERGRADAYAQRLVLLEQKLANAPKDANLKAWRDQIENETKASLKSYMDDIDAHHDRMRDTYQEFPKAVRAIDASFNSLRRSTAQRFGNWQGYKQDGVPAAPPSAVPPPAAPKEKGPEPLPKKQQDLLKQYQDLRNSGGSDEERQAAINSAREHLSPAAFKLFMQQQ